MLHRSMMWNIFSSSPFKQKLQFQQHFCNLNLQKKSLIRETYGLPSHTKIDILTQNKLFLIPTGLGAFRVVFITFSNFLDMSK